MYRAKLLVNTVAVERNVILGNSTTAVPLKYLNNFCRLLEIAMLNSH